MAWHASSITDVVVAVTEQPSKTVLTVLVHGVYVLPPEIDSVQYLVKSVAVCVCEQLSNFEVVVPLTEQPCVICFFVEVQIVRGAGVAEDPFAGPATSVMMLQNAVRCVAVLVSHSLWDEL
jgi:hypothetical protein